MEYDFEKKVHWSLDRISSFHKESAYRIVNNSNTINGSIATIEKDKEEFSCKIFLEKLHDYTFNQNIEKFGVFESIEFEKSGDIYFSRENSANSVSVTLSSPQVLTLSLTSFQSGRESDFNERKQRLVIPISKDPDFSIIECKSLHIDGTTTFCGLIDIEIHGKKYHLFKHENKDLRQNYLFIDGLERDDFLNFKLNCDAIMTAFGYLSGDLFLDEYYYLTFDEKNPELVDNILFEKKEKSALTSLQLFEPFRFREYLKALEKDKQYDHVLSYMIGSVFSNLCSIIRENESFSRCCQLIIEGNQSRQILLKAGIYSIALETLTNIIYNENKQKVNPIEDKKLAAIIREKLKAVVSEYDSFISSYGLKILDAKINEINKPTNSKKLSRPFELYKIKLTADDVEILNHRNKFLHGTSPFSEDNLKEKESELQFIIARLHYMLNSLMLKYVGYTGHIINYPAWIQFKKGEKLTDHLFRII